MNESINESSWRARIIHHSLCSCTCWYLASVLVQTTRMSSHSLRHRMKKIIQILLLFSFRKFEFFFSLLLLLLLVFFTPSIHECNADDNCKYVQFHTQYIQLFVFTPVYVRRRPNETYLFSESKHRRCHQQRIYSFPFSEYNLCMTSIQYRIYWPMVMSTSAATVWSCNIKALRLFINKWWHDAQTGTSTRECQLNGRNPVKSNKKHFLKTIARGNWIRFHVQGHIQSSGTQTARNWHEMIDTPWKSERKLNRDTTTSVDRLVSYCLFHYKLGARRALDNLDIPNYVLSAVDEWHKTVSCCKEMKRNENNTKKENEKIKLTTSTANASIYYFGSEQVPVFLFTQPSASCRWQSALLRHSIHIEMSMAAAAHTTCSIALHSWLHARFPSSHTHSLALSFSRDS